MKQHPTYAYRQTMGMNGEITWSWVEEAPPEFPQTVWVRMKDGARYISGK